MQQLPEQLIIKVLALTGKTMDDMVIKHYTDTVPLFSIEKLCFYLLSHEFVDIYYPIFLWNNIVSDDYRFRVCESFWTAIYEYQKWNAQPIIDLLSKI